MNLSPIMSLLLAFSFITVDSTDHMELFWNLYGAVVRGTRILHDVTQGVGTVSKAISAIDIFLDVKLGEKDDSEADPTAKVDPTAKTDPTAKVAVTLDTEVPANLDIAPNFKSNLEASAFNGCGALGFHIQDKNLPIASMTQCCMTHDKCYNASCRVNKRECDSKLRSCLFSKCDQILVSSDRSIQKTCRSAAKILFSGTMALSFKQYNDAQNSQQCNNDKSKKRKKR